MKNKLSFLLFLISALFSFGCKNLLENENLQSKNANGECNIRLYINPEANSRAISFPSVTASDIKAYVIKANGNSAGTKDYTFEPSASGYEVSFAPSTWTFEIIGYGKKNADNTYSKPLVYKKIENKVITAATTTLNFSVEPITQKYTSGELQSETFLGEVAVSSKFSSSRTKDYKVNFHCCPAQSAATGNCFTSGDKDLISGSAVFPSYSNSSLKPGKHTVVMTVADSDGNALVYSKTFYIAVNLTTSVMFDLSSDSLNMDSCAELDDIELYEDGSSINLCPFSSLTDSFSCEGVDSSKSYNLLISMKTSAQNIKVEVKKSGEAAYSTSDVPNPSAQFIDLASSTAQKLTYAFVADKIINSSGPSSVRITVTKGSGTKVYTLNLSAEEPAEPEDSIVNHPVDVSGYPALPVPVTDLSETTYVITTEAQLRALAEFVNGGGVNTGKTFILGRSIALTNDWEPIGESTSNPFMGVFEGNNYIITGLNITSYNSTYGFIGSMDSGTVKNLTVKGNIDFSSGEYIGGICGYAFGNSVIDNCINNVKINGDEKCGGIVGYYSEDPRDSNSLRITNCLNFAPIHGSDYCAGILGRSYTSGLVVYNCANYASVTSEVLSAGICLTYDSSKIENSYNDGIIKGDIMCSPISYGGTDANLKYCYYLKECTYEGDALKNCNALGYMDRPNPSDVTSYTHRIGSSKFTLETNVNSAADLLSALNNYEGIGTTYNRWVPSADANYFGLPVFKDTIARLKESVAPVNLLSALYTSSAVLGSVPESGKTYEISTEDDLIYLRTLTDAEKQCSGVIFEQVNSITLASENWNPIGSGVDTSKNRFSGTYDGKGYKVTNLKITTTKNYAGLFGVCYKAIIKNLTVEGEITSTGANEVGGIVADLRGSNAESLIDNCLSKVTIYSTSKYVGGICGNLTYGVIRNCVNLGNITCGNATADLYGGIAGHTGQYIYNCVNLGDITGATAFGGISGDNGTRMLNCYNAGTVKLNEYSSSSSYGGITGASSNSEAIKNCFTEAGKCLTSFQGSTPAGSTFTNINSLLTALNSFDWQANGLTAADFNEWTISYNGYPLCIQD